MNYDVVVIGAGPAGMAAAATAAELGLSTLLLDEQAGAGGQIYRNVRAAAPGVVRILGDQYASGVGLVQRLEASGAEVRQHALVWDASAQLELAVLQGERSFRVQARQLIAATGALERPSPVPGWTLPGVMNAGAAQVALKSAAAIPSGRVVLAGTGPLLLLVACQLLQAGAQVVALVETGKPLWFGPHLPRLPNAVRAPDYLVKGARMLMQLRRSGVRWVRGATGLRVEGTERAGSLAFEVDRAWHAVEADTVLLHHGVIPNQQLTRLLRVEHVWDALSLAWHVARDAYGQTSLDGFRVAGDGAAILGASSAEGSGALAALGAAHALGRLSDTRLRALARPHLKAMRREAAIRPFLDALYRPPGWVTHPAGDVVVCRCEEVTAGQVREMAALGCRGPNQAKFFSRCGMGPCQGRVCGTVVTQLLAQELGKPPREIGAFRVRPPLKPVSIGALAALAEDAPAA